MQLLAEAYHLMKDLLNMSPPDIAQAGYKPYKKRYVFVKTLFRCI